jgi:molecular chaperone GrpE
MIEEEKQFENHESPAVATSEGAGEATDTGPGNGAGSSPEAAASEPMETQATDEAAADTAPEPAVSVDQAALVQLAQEIESLKTQLDERNNLYMRIAADFENFRKRTAKEKEDLEQKVKRDTLSELLPVVDSFERARAHIKPQTDAENTIHKSYQGVYKQLVDVFKRIGVAPMRPEGQPFDPNLHEAVMREPSVDYPEGTVLEELVRGYLLGDRVLRHALVKVAAEPEPATAPEESA